MTDRLAPRIILRTWVARVIALGEAIGKLQDRLILCPNFQMARHLRRWETRPKTQRSIAVLVEEALSELARTLRVGTPLVPHLRPTRVLMA